MDNHSNKTMQDHDVRNLGKADDHDSLDSETSDFLVSLECDKEEITVLTDEGELENSGENTCNLKLSIINLDEKAQPVTGLNINVTLTDRRGEEYGPYQMDLMCSLENILYGTTVDLEEGKYEVSTEIMPENPSGRDSSAPVKKEVNFGELQL